MQKAVPQINLLDSEAKQRIHESTLSILEETGIQIDSEKIANLMKEYGISCEVCGKRGTKTLWRVKFGRDVIMKTLESAPKKITLGGRDTKHDLHLDGKGSPNSIYFGSLGSAPVVQDIETDERRLGTLQDLAKFASLTQQMEHIDFFHVSVMPSDVPKQVVDLCRWKTTFENTAKHSITAAVYDGRNLPFLIEMASVVQGGEDELRRRPILSATECPIAPLYFAERAAENIVELARAGLPVIIYSEPFAGASSPITIAGTLLVTNAEALAGVALTQIVNPGAPVIYGSVATTMDIRTGNISFGSPETGLLNIATTEMARFYGLPNQCSGGRTDSKIPDCQAGFEKQGNLLLAVLCGANLNNCAGMLESNYAVSLTQLVIDDDIIKRTKRILEGTSWDAERLALDLIKEIGPGGQYLGNQHTLDHMRQELSLSDLTSKGTYENWLKQGGLSLEKTARKKAIKLLAASEPVYLEQTIVQEMDKILESAKKMHGLNK
jgi:trimethylamine--corrinoid protein Co-methyltransferase